MRLLIRASLLFDGYELREGVELSVVDGVVRWGRCGGSYDRVIDVATVLPGLVDGHLHLVYDQRPKHFLTSVTNVVRLFLAHGVLGVRDAGNYMGVDNLFQSVEGGALEVVTTLMFEAPPPSWPHTRVASGVEDVRRLAEVARVEGCRWFKFYDRATEELAREAVASAHSRGLKVSCHPTGVGVRRVVEMGVDMVEHASMLAILEPRREGEKLVELWERIDEGTIEELAREMRSRGTAVSTTLALLRGFANRLRVDSRKLGSYVFPWYRFFKSRWRDAEKIYRRVLRAVKILSDEGVELVAGTDLPNAALSPGLSLWEELDALMEAGLDLWTAIRAATGSAHRVLGTETGVIAEGSIARLVLVGREVKRVEDLRHIEAVVIGERVLSVEELRRGLRKLPMFS